MAVFAFRPSKSLTSKQISPTLSISTGRNSHSYCIPYPIHKQSAIRLVFVATFVFCPFKTLTITHFCPHYRNYSLKWPIRYTKELKPSILPVQNPPLTRQTRIKPYCYPSFYIHITLTFHVFYSVFKHFTHTKLCR